MRLIDADELIKDLMEEIPLAENVPIFKDIIENQPTAYDIDKVVEELEKEIELYENSQSIMGGNDLDIEYDGAMKGLGKAIEIVKQGLNQAFNEEDDIDINEALSDLNSALKDCIEALENYDKNKNIYIIGSLSQANQIKKVADSIKDADVRYVKPEPAKTFNECVSTCFDNIEWADSIYAVLKPNGTIGQGVTYELEYAKRLNKKIQYVSEVEE